MIPNTGRALLPPHKHRAGDCFPVRGLSNLYPCPARAGTGSKLGREHERKRGCAARDALPYRLGKQEWVGRAPGYHPAWAHLCQVPHTGAAASLGRAPDIAAFRLRFPYTPRGDAGTPSSVLLPAASWLAWGRCFSAPHLRMTPQHHKSVAIHPSHAPAQASVRDAEVDTSDGTCSGAVER